MKRSQILALLFFTLLLLVPPALGQGDAEPIEPKDPAMVNPEAHISFPPPVYVVRDRVEIRGTVTLAAMRNFFIEYRPLALGMMMDDDAADNQWFPATLPRIEAVADDVLGAWNTAVAGPDGLYELRLRINTGGDEPEFYRVSPIRVENDPPSFMADQQVVMMDETDAPADEQAQPMDEPMDEPAPEPTPDPRPHVVATVNSNVRAGDSTVYAIIGHLLENDRALVKGVSSRGSGWYYIELPNGRSGFIYPHIVRTEGEFSNLPRINPPPPPPPTPVPIPTAVPAPPQQTASNVDLVFHSVVIHPHGVKCGESYRITVQVRNAGSGPASSGGHIIVRDSGLNGSAQPQTTEIAFGPLNAGAVQEVFGHITPTIHVETTHNINLHLDGHNQVPETNEGNNHHATAPYFLSSGC